MTPDMQQYGIPTQVAMPAQVALPGQRLPLSAPEATPNPQAVPGAQTVGLGPGPAPGVVAPLGAPSGGPPPGFGVGGYPPHLAPYGQNSYGVHPAITPHQVIEHLLPSFRNVESSNNYKVANKNSSASGAYQYLDSTWNNHKGYARAMDAPPEVQDARMRQDLLHNLTKYGGDPFKAVAAHLYPAYAHDTSKWNQPLVDNYGKEIPGAGTVRQYVSKVIPAKRVDAYLAGSGQRLTGGPR